MKKSQLTKLAFLDRQFPFWGIYYRVFSWSTGLDAATNVDEVREELLKNYEALNPSGELTKVAQIAYRWLDEDLIPLKLRNNLTPKYNDEPKKEVLTFLPDLPDTTEETVDLLKTLTVDKQVLLVKLAYKKLNKNEKMLLGKFLEEEKVLISALEMAKKMSEEYRQRFMT